MTKKLLALLMSGLLLIGTFVCSVAAEGFDFEEVSRVIDGDTLVIQWNSGDVPAGSMLTVEEVTIGDTVCTPYVEQPGMLSVDISDVPPGRHSVTYTYTLDGTEDSVTMTERFVKEGLLAVTLTIEANADGSVTVTAVDDNGNPVAGYTLQLTIGAMQTEETTGANGTFTSRIKLEYGEKASCMGSQTVIDGITYTDASQVEVVHQKPTTTTTTTTTTGSEGEETTTTADPAATETTTTVTQVTTTAKPVNATTVTTTPPSYATIIGTGTTAKKDGKIAVNVSLDEHILQLFGLKAADFDNNARLLIGEEDYSNLVGRNNTLMLNMLAAANEATDAQVAAAIANVSKFSAYDEEHRVAITFDLSFLMLDRTGNPIPVSALPLNSTYIVQLPVPAGMKDCDMLAITLFDGDGLMEPMEVDVKNGCFQLEINSLEPYTLIGFRNGTGGNAGGSSVLLIVLLVVGILLLVGAALLLYFFVLRKPEPKKPVPKKEPSIPESFDENDIFSGRDDYPEISRRPPTDT